MAVEKRSLRFSSGIICEPSAGGTITTLVMAILSIGPGAAILIAAFSEVPVGLSSIVSRVSCRVAVTKVNFGVQVAVAVLFSV